MTPIWMILGSLALLCVVPRNLSSLNLLLLCRNLEAFTLPVSTSFVLTFTALRTSSWKIGDFFGIYTTVLITILYELELRCISSPIMVVLLFISWHSLGRFFEFSHTKS